jgi:hypothetical protein
MSFGEPDCKKPEPGSVVTKHLCRSHRTVPALGAVDGDAFQVGMLHLVPHMGMAYPTADKS